MRRRLLPRVLSQASSRSMCSSPIRKPEIRPQKKPPKPLTGAQHPFCGKIPDRNQPFCGVCVEGGTPAAHTAGAGPRSVRFPPRFDHDQKPLLRRRYLCRAMPQGISGSAGPSGSAQDARGSSLTWLWLLVGFRSTAVHDGADDAAAGGLARADIPAALRPHRPPHLAGIDADFSRAGDQQVDSDPRRRVRAISI